MQLPDVSHHEPVVMSGDAIFRVAFFGSPVAMAIVDDAGRILCANRAICALLGYGGEELAGKNLSAIIHAQDMNSCRQAMSNVAGDPKNSPLHLRLLHQYGKEITGQFGLSAAKTSPAEPIYILTHLNQSDRHTCLEDDRRQALEMIAQDQPLPSIFYQVVRLVERQFSGSWACIMLLNEGTVRSFAPSLPGPLAEAINRHPVAFAAGISTRCGEPPVLPRVADVETDSAWEGLCDDARKSGVQSCWAMTLAGRDGVAIGLLVLFTPERRSPDGSECARLEAAAGVLTIAVEHHLTTRKLAHLVRHDALTGLPNRILFEDRLHQAVTLARRNGSTLALLAMDLNRFKQINDTLGHQAGDQMLQQFAQRVKSRLREGDTFARVGGDEFMLILPQALTRDDAVVVVERITDALASESFELAGQMISVTSSIGIAVFPEDGDDTILLQRAADAAMYRAKQQNHRELAHRRSA